MPSLAGPAQASHPALTHSKDLQHFLEASEEDWSIEVARANHEAAGGGNSAKRKLANTLQMFRDLGHSTKELIAGKSADEDEDSEYLKARPRWPPLHGSASAFPVHPGSRAGGVNMRLQNTRLLRNACVAKQAVCPAGTESSSCDV